MNEVERLDWIDAMKGVGIILIMMSHTIHIGVLFILYSGFIPLFFISSALTYKSMDIRKRFKRLIIPYFFYCILFILLSTIMNLPLNDSTRGFLSKDKIALMKKDAVFINCARGPIVDNQALADALNEDKLGFACIDVFDMEPPLPADYPLLHAKNTLLTPHQAYISEEAMQRRAEIVFGNVYAYLKGEPVNVVK